MIRAILVLLMAMQAFLCTANASVVVAESYRGEVPRTVPGFFRLSNGAAMGFRPTETIFLDRVDVYFRYGTATNQDTLVEIRSRFDVFEPLPGDVLEAVADPCIGCVSDDYQLRSFEFSGTTRLEEGELYWVSIGSGVRNEGPEFFWAIASPFVEGRAAIRTINGGFFFAPSAPDGIQPQAAYRVFGTIVPAPAAAWLFCSALGLLGFMNRRDH